MDIKINIEDSNRSKVNINLAWGISVAEPNAKGFGKIADIFRKKFHIEKTVTVNIVNLKIDDNIILDDKKPLLLLTYNGNMVDLPLVCELKALSTPFQLFLDTAAITDCNEPEQRSKKKYPITFDVELRDDSESLLDTVHQDIDISFDDISCKPEVRLVLKKKEIQYSGSLTEVKVGYIAAWIPKELHYASSIKLKLSLDLLHGNNKLPDLLYFKDQDGKRLSSIDVEISPGKAKAVKRDVFFDFTDMCNPIDERDKYAIRQRLTYAMSYSEDVIIPMNPQLDEFFILKDTQGTELKLYVEGQEIRNGGVYNRADAFPPCSKMMLTASTNIVNIASYTSNNPLVGLCVKNLSIREQLQENVSLYDANDNIINTICELCGNEVPQMIGSEGYIIKNAPNAHSIIDVHLNPSRVADVKGAGMAFNFELRSIVSFDYCENSDGLSLSKGTWKKFSFTISWQLQLLPHPEWLSIDFGSSAIVCQYDKNLVDLHAQKDMVYKSQYPTYAQDNMEAGEPFLNSQIIFNKVEGESSSSLCTEQEAQNSYKKMAVLLSPTSSLLMERVWWWLPCLKIMVGNDLIPLTNAYYNTYEYLRKEQTSGETTRIRLDKSINENTSLAKVNQIFLQVYNELFKYFVGPSIDADERHINKLVLTYPYNYTPRHIKMMKDVVTKTFPFIRDGYLKFVSESDAVASYYIDNWKHYNPSEDIKKDENVLVYDMGAGTLDITVFKKYKNTRTGKLCIKIIGHLGSNKAGDYLDYILAEIVSDLFTLDDTNHLVSTLMAATQSEAQARLTLKNSVKNKLKLKLNDEDSNSNTVLDVEDINGIAKRQHLLISRVLEDERFKSYIDDVTKGVINKLLSYFNKSHLEIDTLIMSGRSSQLKPLRNALVRAITEVNKHAAKVLYFESVTKTSVVKGAIAKASRFDLPNSNVSIIPLRVYASYGILYATLGGTYKYTELLSPSTAPKTDEDFDTPQVLVGDLGDTDYIMLVQTYLSEDEVAKSFDNKDLELIAIMGEYEMSAFGNPESLNVKLHVTKDNDIQLYANGKISIPNPPRGTNLQSEETKRSIWPVTI